MLVTSRDIYCLQLQFGASKEQITKAIAAVGNNPIKIEQYLQQQSKPHIMQLLNSKVDLNDGYSYAAE